MRPFALAAVAALFCFDVRASETENLRGLRTFLLVVEPPSAAAIKCGFTKTWLTARVAPVVSKAGLSLVEPENSPDGHIEVYVTVLPDCSASAAIEVSTLARIEKSGRQAMVTVWRAGGVGGKDGTARNFDGLAKALASEWRSVNQ
jgi:hypothetical protein